MGSTWGKMAALARGRRNNTSEAGLRMWDLLKNRQLAGYRFQRQYRLGNQIVDFYCPSERLIVLIDGAGNAPSSQVNAAMDQAHRERGFRLARLSEDEVMRRPDAAVLRIFQALRRGPVIIVA